MDRLEELTARLLDGPLASAEKAELAAILADDPAAQAGHIALLRLEAALRGLGPAPDVAAATLERMQRESSTDLERSVMQTIGSLPTPRWTQAAVVKTLDKRSRRATLFAVAASLLLFASLGGWWLRKGAIEREQFPAITSATAAVEVIDTTDRSRSVVVGMRLGDGQSLRTQDDDQAVLEYADGTRVELFGPSQLVVELGPHGAKRLRLIRGGMELDVRRQPVGRPLVVITPEGEAEVLGTKFRIAAGTDRTRIEMQEGTVAFLHRADGRTVEVSEGAFLVAESKPEPVAVHPLPPKLSAPLWSHKKLGRAMALSADGARLAVAGHHGGGVLFDADTGEVLVDHSLRKGEIDTARYPRLLAFAPDDRTLWSVDRHGTVEQWNLEAGTRVPVSLGVDVGELRAFDGSGRLFGHTLGKGHQRPLLLWDVSDATSPRRLHEWRGKEDLWGAAISPNGKSAAIGTRVGKLHWFDVASGEERWQVQAGSTAIMRLVISADERYLAYWSAQEGIQLWSPTEQRLITTWFPEAPGVMSMAFSPDGRWLAAGLSDRTVRLWSTADHRPALLIELPGDRAEQLVFTRDGRRLATCGGDVAVWELPWNPSR
jgi:ferric-dicitrate binding protein FerR (iron transport regulator)